MDRIDEVMHTCEECEFEFEVIVNGQAEEPATRDYPGSPEEFEIWPYACPKCKCMISKSAEKALIDEACNKTGDDPRDFKYDDDEGWEG